MKIYAAFTHNGFGTKRDVCENGFPSFKTQNSCLQF